MPTIRADLDIRRRPYSRSIVLRDPETQKILGYLEVRYPEPLEMWVGTPLEDREDAILEQIVRQINGDQGTGR